MSESSNGDAGSLPIVHGLLVCRNAEFGEDGSLTLEGVLEILAVPQLPGRVGPLTFVAFLRGAPPGKTQSAFVITPAGAPETELARLPLTADVSPALAGRQLVVQVRLPEQEMKAGGAFDLTFEWDGTPLAQNRFVVGMPARSQ